MAQHQVSVISKGSGRKRLPDWATAYVRLVTELRARGLLDAAGEHLQVARQGGYCGMDIMLFLLAFFSWGGGTSFKEFGLACLGFGPALAAVGGRQRWPAPSSVSRFLAVVRREDAQIFATWALGPGSCGQSLLSSTLAQGRDTRGRGLTLLDFDPVCLAVRQRALPEGADLPVAQREADDMCKPGYPGRKRGETQVSQARLQHAGTGQWLGAATTPGNANMNNCLTETLAQAMPTLTMAGIVPAEIAVRFDGAGGYVPHQASRAQRRLVRTEITRRRPLPSAAFAATSGGVSTRQPARHEELGSSCHPATCAHASQAPASLRRIASRPPTSAQDLGRTACGQRIA